jgi:hypothetical protein
MTESLQSSLPAHLDSLLAALQTGGDQGVEWLRRTLAGLQSSDTAEAARDLGGPFAAAGRRVGSAPLPAGPDLETPCGRLTITAWRRDDAARACLLLAALGSPVDPAILVDVLYRTGDEGERASLLRCLCLLPEPVSALPTAKAAGRTNSLQLYAALALDNPFPAGCYGEHDFNQLVLKCLFNGLPIARVAGLSRRANPALSRMCEDYRDERVAAGRAVPPDIWLALVPHADERGLALACEQLEQGTPEHRAHALNALATRRNEPNVAAALASTAQQPSCDSAR